MGQATIESGTGAAWKLRTISAIRQANKAAGMHWFTGPTMRFFQCRVLPTVWVVDDGSLFVTSEQDVDAPRFYTVRFCYDLAQDGAGRIKTVGGFQAWITADEAKRHAARRAARWIGIEAETA